MKWCKHPSQSWAKWLQSHNMAWNSIRDPKFPHFPTIHAMCVTKLPPRSCRWRKLLTRGWQPCHIRVSKIAFHQPRHDLKTPCKRGSDWNPAGGLIDCDTKGCARISIIVAESEREIDFPHSWGTKMISAILYHYPWGPFHVGCPTKVDIVGHIPSKIIFITSFGGVRHLSHSTQPIIICAVVIQT